MTRSSSAPKSPAASGSSNKTFLLVVGVIVVVGLAGVAWVASSRDSGVSEGARQADPTDDVDVDGESLTPMPENLQVTGPETDPEAGVQAPTLTGTDFADTEVTIGPDGRAKAVYFLAHWCPHCRAELPLVQELIDEGAVPEGVDIYAVSTAVDEGGGNFPPSVWLEQAGFDGPVIRDDAASSALQAYGGSGFPYVVYLDGENQVVARSAGELGRDGITTMWDALTATAG